MASTVLYWGGLELTLEIIDGQLDMKTFLFDLALDPVEILSSRFACSGRLLAHVSAQVEERVSTSKLLVIVGRCRVTAREAAEPWSKGKKTSARSKVPELGELGRGELMSGVMRRRGEMEADSSLTSLRYGLSS